MNEDKKKKLKDILKKISSPEEMAEFESDKTSEKLDVIASAFGAISAMKGKDGEDGITPKKGTDYFTKPEIEWFLKKVTPVKGTDYEDGKDGYSPVRGKDYYNGEDGETPKHKWIKTLLQFTNPDKTWGELVDLKGEKGEIGLMPKHEWKGTKLRFETAEGKWGKLIDLKGKDGTSSKWTSPGGWIGGGISKFTQLSDVPNDYVGNSGNFVKVKSTEDGLEFDTSSTVVTWGGIGGTLANQTDLNTALGLKLDASTASSTYELLSNKQTDLTASATKYPTVNAVNTGLALKATLAGTTGGQTLIGGTAVTDILKLQGTSGNGTLTSPAIQALVGNNGGTTALTILNSGNVGIGTTGPVNSLDVNGGMALGSYAGNNVAGSGNLIVSGNVGIGTTNPQNKLDVNGNINMVSDGVITTNNNGTIGFGFHSGNAIDVTSFGNITFKSYNGSSYAPVMTILGTQSATTGNVGIGTAAPLELLDVNGRVHLAQTTAPGTTTDRLYNVGGSLYWNGINLGAGGTGASQWTTNGTSVYYNGGNVGIGTTSPSAVLHLKASQAGANLASMKIDVGVVATTPVSGNIESDGTHLYWTDSGGTRRQLDN